MSADEARRIVRGMHARGSITAGERDNALREIEAGRATRTIDRLRRLLPAVTE